MCVCVCVCVCVVRYVRTSVHGAAFPFVPAPPMAGGEATRGGQASCRVPLHCSPSAVLSGGPLRGSEEAQPDGTATGHGTGWLRGHGAPDGQAEGGWGGGGG